MKYERILVITKNSRYELLCRRNGQEKVDGLIRNRDPIVRSIHRSHIEHLKLTGRVEKYLDSRGCRFRTARAFERRPVGRFDLVITIGGDGTFLWASHSVDRACLMGINSSPAISAGVFCAAGPSDYKEVLARALEDRLPVKRLTRIEALTDGRSLGVLALNDVLFAHCVPAATSRYFLKMNGVEETQRSSGVWIATAAGSTAAVRSAGGRVMPIESRRIQYVVREPFEQGDRGFRHKKGFIRPGEQITIRSRMNHGKVFIDGSHSSFDIAFGSLVTLKPSHSPLKVLGMKGRTI